MAEYIKNINGLETKHNKQEPLFEKVYTPPEYGDKLVSRIYNDGSLYYLSQPRESNETLVKEEDWAFIGTVSETGINKIKEKLKKVCGFERIIENQGIRVGEYIWKTRCGLEIIEIMVYGVPEGKYAIFNEISDVINND